MSLSMLGMIDPTFGNGVVTIRSVNGAYVNGLWVDAVTPTETTHFATKQVASSEELRQAPEGGERITDVARFLINDGSQHAVGSELFDKNGKLYRIFDADNRPERAYCKLVGASYNA